MFTERLRKKNALLARCSASPPGLRFNYCCYCQWFPAALNAESARCVCHTLFSCLLAVVYNVFNSIITHFIILTMSLFSLLLHNICVYVCIYVCVCTYVFMYMCVSMYLCMCVWLFFCGFLFIRFLSKGGKKLFMFLFSTHRLRSPFWLLAVQQ